MKTIGVFFGSQSPEHDVSIITGEFIIAELKKMGYPVVPVYIGKKGEWYISETVGTLRFFLRADYQTELARNNFHKYFIDLEASHGTLVLRRKGLGGREVVVDIAFPALHGAYGEDGTIQGIFEMLNVPYVGCGVTASAVTMDKVLTKLLYQAQNIPTTPFTFFTWAEWERDKSAILNSIRSKFTGAVFVKPARLGSSIGIAKVADLKTLDLEHRLEVALHYDTKILVEEAVEPFKDITCALISNGEALTASLLQESVFGNDLFGFEEKYLDQGGAQLGRATNKLIIPAAVPEAQATEIRQLAKKIFQLFDCSGIARVDFLYNTMTGLYFANEINSLPGTLYHHLWKASGLEIREVLENLVTDAISRYHTKQNIIHTFDSDILAQANSLKLGAKL